MIEKRSSSIIETCIGARNRRWLTVHHRARPRGSQESFVRLISVWRLMSKLWLDREIHGPVRCRNQYEKISLQPDGRAKWWWSPSWPISKSMHQFNAANTAGRLLLHGYTFLHSTSANLLPTWILRRPCLFSSFSPSFIPQFIISWPCIRQNRVSMHRSHQIAIPTFVFIHLQ